MSDGVEGQKYRLDFEASAAQGVVCVLECRLTGRRARTYDEQDGRGHLRQLSGALAQSGVLDEPPTTPRFLPDTLVGRITITAPGRSHGKQVDALWANEQRSNIHAWIDGAWQKLQDTHDDACTNLAVLAAHAKDGNRNVDARVEDGRLKEMYVW